MRKLTIKRTKSFVACAVKLKVYIEDPFAAETTIGNVPCRKLGTLKNGEEKSFDIEDKAARIFVIADSLSKEYCNEFYDLPEGQEDIFLSGKNEFNPASGNAFRFDNNPSEAALANRKQGTRRGFVVYVAAIIIGFIAGYLIVAGLFSAPEPKEKAFSSGGMTITLTDEFQKASLEGYSAVYNTEKIVVFTLKESFTLLEGLEDYTLKQYGEVVVENNGLKSNELKTKDGLTYFEYDYTDSATKESYHYFAYIYKSDDAFWLIQFATLKKDANTYAQQIAEYAKSVTFSK